MEGWKNEWRPQIVLGVSCNMIELLCFGKLVKVIWADEIHFYDGRGGGQATKLYMAQNNFSQ
jgi:hypothetical protein